MSKVYVFLADGFEEIEGLTVVDVLRRAGVETVTVSVTGRTQIRGSHGIMVGRTVCLKKQVQRMRICSFFRAACRAH